MGHTTCVYNTIIASLPVEICFYIQNDQDYVALTIGQDDAKIFDLDDIVAAPFQGDLDAWLRHQSQESVPGFEEEEEDDSEETSNRAYVYAALNTRFPQAASRELILYTYGRRHRKHVPGAQASFNACVLSGRRRGLNLKKLNGLNEDVQKSVETSRNYETFLTQLVQKIERDNLTRVAICCTAGRHRSVSSAELLKKHVYRKAIVVHIELKRTTR